MITEEQQEQAALYALGLLTADEAAAFEAATAVDPELTSLARELRETASRTVLALPQVTPSGALRARVLGLVAAEGKTPVTVRPLPEKAGPLPEKAVLLHPFAWVPWAIAAGLAVFCGVLVSERSDLRRQLAQVMSADPLSQVAVYSLDPASEKTGAVVSVAWAPSRQSGLLKVNGLPLPGPGKDYQLWAVDAGRKEPISAGVVKIDEKGHVQVEFKPDAAAQHVSAFAISVEPEGGSPTKTGPIVFVGGE
jgi:anti-sigma-K factor RskA